MTDVSRPASRDVAVPGAWSAERELIEATNQHRALGVTCARHVPDKGPAIEQHTYAPGAAPVASADSLSLSALAHAEWMARTGHYRHQAEAALERAGAAGENIAYAGPVVRTTTITHADGTETEEAESIPRRAGADLARRFVRNWIGSPGHCHNLMQPQWRRTGQAAAQADDGTWYGVQLYAE